MRTGGGAFGATIITSADALPATAATPARTIAAWTTNKRIFMIGLLSWSPRIAAIHTQCAGHGLADSALVTAMAKLQRNIDVSRVCDLKVQAHHVKRPESNDSGLWMLRAKEIAQRWFKPSSTFKPMEFRSSLRVLRDRPDVRGLPGYRRSKSSRTWKSRQRVLVATPAGNRRVHVRPLARAR